MAIFIHSTAERFSITGKNRIKHWLKETVIAEGLIPGNINIIIVSDNKLLDMNKKYLRHNYFTDIVTFDYKLGRKINGDLYISIDRIRENAKRFGNTDINELLRVIVHGVLHIIGYDDKNDEMMKEIRWKENYYLKRIEEEEIKINV